MLSQLSYRPDSFSLQLDLPRKLFEVVGPGRVELPTLPLSGARSSQLSYRPSQHMNHACVPAVHPGSRQLYLEQNPLTVLRRMSQLADTSTGAGRLSSNHDLF
jgi:hypothetical protein